MANELDNNRVEANACKIGDQTVGKVTFAFAEVMEGRHKDPLMEALFKNEVAINLASARVEDIYKRAAQVHPEGLTGFLRNHETQYA